MKTFINAQLALYAMQLAITEREFISAMSEDEGYADTERELVTMMLNKRDEEKVTALLKDSRVPYYRRFEKRRHT